MRVIVNIGPGPAWIPGRSVFEQGEPVAAHLVSMRNLYDAGRLLVGGPFASANSGMALLDVEGLDEAREIMDADPGVTAGVFSYELVVWRAYFDVFAGVRTNQLDFLPARAGHATDGATTARNPHQEDAGAHLGRRR